jgi:hypothetical protein
MVLNIKLIIEKVKTNYKNHVKMFFTTNPAYFRVVFKKDYKHIANESSKNKKSITQKITFWNIRI